MAGSGIVTLPIFFATERLLADGLPARAEKG
jgi:hypothetical protein